MTNSISINTNVFDLDWNRHVTSRTYEKFSQAGRFAILAESGFSIKDCIENGIEFIPEYSSVRFLSQQFSGSKLTINTTANTLAKGRIFWNHKIIGEDGKLACELDFLSKSIDKSGNEISLLNSSELQLQESSITEINPFTNSCKRLTNDYPILYTDMNFLWGYWPDSIWKIFEEGRWLFFSQIIDLGKIAALDTTSFFMGGKIQYFKTPIAGEKIKIHTWIDSVEKIRFYIRQDIIRENGDLLASMKDEQLFVSLSTSRPRRAPEDFLNTIKDYLEYP